MTEERPGERPEAASSDPSGSGGTRLQKVLAAAGIASRRASEQLIRDGRVEVNGSVVDVQGMRVDPYTDVVRVDGDRIPPPRDHVYLVLNKPRGVVSTMDDPDGRPTLTQYLEGRSERLFHVGRLDADTEGLLLLTNDGEFAHRLAHPSYEVPKTYVAEVSGQVGRSTLAKLRQPLELEDGPVSAEHAAIISSAPERSMVTITLHEGRNRIVRRILDSVGHPVRRLSRVAIGPVKLGQLKPGDTRELTRDELGELLDLVDG